MKIKIRKANKFDTDYFIDTVLKLQQAEHNQFVSQVNLDVEYLKSLFYRMIYGQGIAYIATDNKEPIGLVIGAVTPNLWDPKTQFLHQIILYVEEDYRYTRAAYNLISCYTDQGKKMIEEGRILNYTFGLSEPMFNLNMGRFGFELKEMIWMGGL